jgi:hypothetical protein
MALLNLISLIEEILLAEPTGVHWNIRHSVHDGTMLKARWYDDEKAMIRWWKHNGTNMKQRLDDGETTMVRCWNKDVTMVKYDGTILKMWWHDYENAIVSSWFHHCAIVVSSSYHRTFTIVPSCIAVQGDKNVTYVKEHRNRAIFVRD